MKNLISLLDEWAKRNHPLWIDVLRMVFGVLLVAKAIIFIGAAPTLHPKWLLVPVSAIHILGGTFIMLGLLTRWASLLQLPALIIAVFFTVINMKGFYLSSEILLTVILFFLSLLFFAEGSGKISFDQFIRNSYKTTTPN
jgi:putative oxidoreductase